MLAPTSHEKQEINKETVFLKSTKLLTLLSHSSLFSETSGMMKTMQLVSSTITLKAISFFTF